MVVVFRIDSIVYFNDYDDSVDDYVNFHDDYDE